ncbi:hypothetical protein SAMN05661091_5007 [Paenibacillus uliginis N3/975]|uniref:Uncharacterized protein n=1 Tax=Paenibacillus uliginis N3/975 TaxID=1313296 RepID=A0A1X7HQW9_9BACL|nr:hypothetical protein SAMN05661091_5007 [Paenibacillus uliginis N3/975]
MTHPKLESCPKQKWIEGVNYSRIPTASADLPFRGGSVKGTSRGIDEALATQC